MIRLVEQVTQHEERRVGQPRPLGDLVEHGGVQRTEAEEDAEPATAGEYEIDPRNSTITFTTRHLFGLHGVQGRFEAPRGRIVVGDPAERSEADVVVAAASFETGTPKRDDHVRSADYLHAERHPEIRFRGLRAERSAAGWVMHGELTVRGVTQPLSVAVEPTGAQGRRVRARATATIDRYAFGLVKGKGMAGRRVTLEIDVTATRN